MITVEWVEEEESYIVEQEGVFIKDDQDLHSALEFALAVGNAHGIGSEEVIVIAVE